MLYCLIWLPSSFTDLNVLDSVIKHFSSTEEELPFLQVTVKFYWYSKSLGLLFLSVYLTMQGTSLPPSTVL